MSDPHPTLPDLPALLAEFRELEDWDERYEYLIDLGKQLPELPEAWYIPANQVRGCMSTVWMVLEDQRRRDGAAAVRIHVDSDSLIVRGLITVLLALFDGKTADEIVATDEQAVFRQLGLDQNLSPQRRNGLHAMVQRIRQWASERLAGKSG